MVQGGGSAMVARALMLGLMLLHCELAQAAVYVVGGPAGWSFNVDSWPKGKRFRAGDILEFNYDPAFHNVVAVNRPGYRGCTTPSGAKVYQTGKDRIKLAKGRHFYICNFPGHCQAGMKIAVTAI